MTSPQIEMSLDAMPFGILPAGRLVRVQSQSDEQFWLSRGPVLGNLWVKLRALHPRSGLWPVYFQGFTAGPDTPWGYDASDQPGDHEPEQNAETVLSEAWARHVPVLSKSSNPLNRIVSQQVAAELAPLGPAWPGLAPSVECAVSPEAVADDFAGRLINNENTLLALIPARHSADLVRYCQWQGAAHYLDAEAVSTVLRSWEDRFGTRLVRIGANSMVLSVAAPAATSAAALRVAAEHFAFCRDNIWCGSGGLARYGEELVGAPYWSFYWEDVE